MLSKESKNYIDEAFKDFNLFEPVSKSIVEKYKNTIPSEMIYIWETYGFGDFFNGYLKVVNPMEYSEILTDTTVGSNDSLVLFVTSMADLIIWKDNRASILLFRYSILNPMFKKFDRIFQYLNDEFVFDELLMSKPYNEAVKRLGIPSYDECFGYIPLLSIGGNENSNKVEIVKLKEYIYIMEHFQGKFNF